MNTIFDKLDSTGGREMASTKQNRFVKQPAPPPRWLPYNNLNSATVTCKQATLNSLKSIQCLHYTVQLRSRHIMYMYIRFLSVWSLHKLRVDTRRLTFEKKIWFTIGTRVKFTNPYYFCRLLTRTVDVVEQNFRGEGLTKIFGGTKLHKIILFFALFVAFKTFLDGSITLL